MIAKTVRETIGTVCDGQARWPIALLGDVGTGKTCAALCLLDRVSGEYLTVAELCANIIAIQQERFERWPGNLWYAHEYWRHLGEQELLVLDEIGARERVTDHHYECVKQCMDVREGKPAVYCSNLSLSQIAQVYDDRIASRIQAGTVIQLAGYDRRIK